MDFSSSIIYSEAALDFGFAQSDQAASLSLTGG